MNCDQPQRLPVGATVQAKFTDKSTGKELDLQCIYLVEANRGIMYTYYPGKPTNTSALTQYRKIWFGP